MNKIMQQAKELAQNGANNNEGGPFGAVITDKDGNVIATGNNKVIISHDPTAHAEIVAIRRASEKLGTHDLSNCILYTSCEPCPMCLSAIIWANIKKVYYACTRKDAASIGFRDDMIYEYLKEKNNNVIELKEIDREECKSLFEEYKKKIKKYTNKKESRKISRDSFFY